MNSYSVQDIELTTNTNVVFLLSHGNFARVYYCRDNISSTNRCRAIKVYLREASSVRSNRIITEKLVLQRLSVGNNPYVVKLLSTNKDDKYLYFIMEAYHCGHLGKHINNPNEKVSATIIRNYAAEIISALFYLAKVGIIHRDIKPSNILIDSLGHVKICDFGSSTLLYKPEEYKSIIENPYLLPRTYTVIGTPQYIAPEIIAKKGYSLQVDMWSFGILLCEMFGGIPLFYGVTEVGGERDSNEMIRDCNDGSWPSKESSLYAFSCQNDQNNQNIKSTITIPPTKLDTMDMMIPRAHNNTYQYDNDHFNPWYPIYSHLFIQSISSSYLSLSAWELINQLLVPSPQQRLSVFKPETLKNNTFFQGINWEDIDNGVSLIPNSSFNRELSILDLRDISNNDLRSYEEDIDSRFDGF